MRRTAADGPEDGFTLAEMLVVLALVALGTGIGTTFLAGSGPGRLVDTTTAALAAELRRTRLDAIRRGVPARLALVPGERSLAREDGTSVPIPPSVVVNLVTAREAGTTPGEAAILFLPDGRSTGGRFEIASGDHREAIVVDWLTGLVRSERR